jgi:MoxR-like ATPase
LLEERVLIEARDVAHALWEEIRNAMVEIDRPASLALCCLLAAGHLLVEDVPGVGKTTLAKVIARAIGGHDSRIQCTEDLTAAGVIGQEIESDNPSLRPDEFIPGPLFANAVVLDEFNRATPRMQSGLLEAMEEHAVTVGKRRHALPRPFFCIGTMNPHDNTGTFEMAHASCDRFAMRTGIGYPSEAGERDLLMRFGGGERRQESDPIVAPGDVVQLQKVIAQLPAGEPVRAYLVRLLRSTREHPDVLVGASPRALLSMYRCAQAAALLDNAAEVAVKHVRSLFEPCIAHRIRVRQDASARAVCEEILERTPVPVTTPPPTIAATAGRPQPGAPVQLAA